MRGWMALAAAVVALGTACGGGQQDLGDPVTLGERTFAQWCAPCHGAGGEGNINALNAPALDSTGVVYQLTDEQILEAIRLGGAVNGGTMAPLDDQLSLEQEMAALYYVHTLWTDEQRAAHEAAGGHITATPAPDPGP